MRTDSAGGTVTHTTMSHHEHRLYSQICRSISLTTHHSHFPAMLFDPTRTLTKVAGRLARIPAYNAESRRRVQLTQREASAHTNLLYRIVRHTQARVIPLSNCSHRCSFPLAIDRGATVAAAPCHSSLRPQLKFAQTSWQQISHTPVLTSLAPNCWQYISGSTVSY